MYIIFALTITLTIVYISVNDQYTNYYESKLIEKTKKLSYNAAVLLTEKYNSINESEIEKILNLAFSASSNKDAEIINYTLYTTGGQTVASSDTDGVEINPMADALDCFEKHGNIVEYSDGNITDLEDGAKEKIRKAEFSYTYVSKPLIFSYSPVIIDNEIKYIVLVRTSYEPFISFGESVRISLYSALFKGCLVMVLSYIIVAVRSNAMKKQDNILKTEEKTLPYAKDKTKFYELLKIQIVPIIIGIVSGLPLLWFFFACTGILKFISLFFAVSMLALAAVHILRLLYWLLRWYINKPLSGYSSQVIQFCIFLSVFISVFCYSVQNSYNARIERSRLDGLRLSSIFAAMTLGQTEDDNKILNEKAQDHKFDRKSQCIIVNKTSYGFQIIGNEAENIGGVKSLLNESWDDKTTVMGIRDGYIYGVTPILNDNYEVTALLALRQVYSLYADELKRNTMDFILGMSVTVAAFIIFFIELNKLLEVLSIPVKKSEKRSLKYAPAVRSLVFFAVMCRYIPLFFFTLIVQSIYARNPVPWLPVNLAKTLPLTLILFLVPFGSQIVDKFYRVNQRTSMITGCIVSAGGFLLIAKVNHFGLYLAVLVAAYTGISMVYNGLWDYTKCISRSGSEHPELSGVKKMTAGGDFIGSTVGAVFGAVAYDKFGLPAALLLSAVILLCLGALVRYMLPKPEVNWSEIVDASGNALKHNSAVRFIKSKNIISYALAIIFPTAVVPYFINQFSPIYADSIKLSPSAVSWTSLLQALCIAYIAPGVSLWLSRRLRTPSSLAAISNMLAALGLLIFAAFPGIPTLYIASGFIGIGLGTGRTAVVEGYDAIDATASYKNKDAAYFSFTLIGGQMGTFFFTIAHSLSSNGEFVFIIAVFVIICSVLYIITDRKRGKKA